MMIQSDSIELKESYNSHLSVFAKENIDSSTLSLPLPLSSKKFTTSTTNTQSSSCNVAKNKADIINSPIINVYMIYFGYSSSDYFENSKSINSTASIIQRYIENVGGSTYSNMLTNFQVTNQMAYKGSAFLWNRNMTALTDSAVTNLIGQAITQNKWTVESNAIYQFIFRGDITYKSNTLYGQGWGSYWCGFHSSATFNNQNYLYSVVGDVKFASPDVQIGCFAGIYLGYANKKVFTWSGAAPHPAPQSMNNSAVSKHIQPYFGNYFVSPNHNMFADAIIYTMSHELFETATNPRGQGYYSVAGSCGEFILLLSCNLQYYFILL